jgi:cell division septum initiation protein DivIVA
MDLSVVKQEIQKGLKLYKAFEYGEQVLAVLEGLDANSKELKAANAKLVEENAKLANQVADAESMLNEANAEAKLIKAQASESAAAIVAKAKVEAGVIVNLANDEAASIRAESYKVESSVKEATAELKELEARAKKINDVIEKQKAALAKL